MQKTQSFRLFGKVDIEEIPCRFVDGRYIVYWEDIELVFSCIKHIKNGKVTVTPMRDSNEIR